MHFTFDLMIGLVTYDETVFYRDACCKEHSTMQYALNEIIGCKKVSTISTIHQVAQSCIVMIKNNTHINSNKEQFSVVLGYYAKETMTIYQIRKIVSIFDNYTLAGFLEWLSGERGWKFYIPPSDAEGNTVWKKKCIVTKLNTLQGVHCLFAPKNTKIIVWY